MSSARRLRYADGVRRLFSTAFVVIVLAQACVGDNPAGPTQADGGNGDSGPSTAPDGSTAVSRALTLRIPPLEIVRGQPATFVANLQWSGEPSDVTLTVVGPPGSTSNGPVVVPRTAKTQTFTLGTDVALAYGDQTIQVTATAADLPAVQATASFFVRGLPGALDTSFGEQGRATPAAGAAFLGSITADTDGKFFAIGPTPAGVVIARYTADGLFDQTFATMGIGTCAPPAGLSVGSFVYPWTAQRAGAAYEAAYGFSGPGVTKHPMRLTQPEQGPCSVLPNPPPAPIPNGDGLPQAGGIIWVSNTRDGVVRYDAQGNVDPSWAGGQYFLIPPGAPAADSVFIDIASASPTRLVLSGSASQGTSETWRGYAVLDRSNGKQIARFTSPAQNRFMVGTAPDGTSYFFLGEALFLRVDADGSQTLLTSSFGIAEGGTQEFGAIAFTSDGSPLLLLTNSQTQLQRVVMLDKNLMATQPTVNLEAPIVAVESMFAREAIVDSKRRIIIRHEYDDDTQDPSIVSVHWMVRRYWL